MHNSHAACVRITRQFFSVPGAVTYNPTTQQGTAHSQVMLQASYINFNESDIMLFNQPLQLTPTKGHALEIINFKKLIMRINGMGKKKLEQYYLP